MGTRHMNDLFAVRLRCNVVFRTGEQGEDGLSPSASVLTFDLLVIMGSTVLLTAESALRF